MGKLEHFSHSCPLTSPEIVACGICNICFKDKPIEFACKPCNFDICKACSKLPHKVSHNFHSEHSLEFCLFQYDRKPGFIVCSGCGNMPSCSFYECKECEIYLDLGCALLKNIFTAWDVSEMLHYSHEHLLRRCRPGSDARGSCLLCELPITPSSICYGCVYCYSFLHERCLDLPTEIHHPVHPKHSLGRLDYIRSGGRTSCAACRDKVESVPFGCLECKFYIHMRCVDSLLRGLKHESHEEHRLFYVASNAKEDFGRKSPCQICMETTVRSLGSYYHCIECDFRFHFECLRIPESVFKRSCHVHPLVCKKFSEEEDSLEYCGVCETMVHAGHQVYSCEECDFIGHIECILREEEPSPLYLKDLYSCGEDVTRATNQQDYETNKLENKLMINDIDHNHVMTSIEICELEDKEHCDICEKEILGNPWKCETCSFVTHNFCVELGKPSRHRCHWKHLLTLLPKPLATDMMISCKSCREDIKGFNLFCRICDFIIHVSCAMKGKRFLGMLGPKVVGTWRGRCVKGKHRMVQVMFSRSYQIVCVICNERVFGKAVSCLECETVYHLRCIDQRRSKDMIVDRKQ